MPRCLPKPVCWPSEPPSPLRAFVPSCLCAFLSLFALTVAARAEDRVVRSENGARLKVIARRATAIHAKPEAGSATQRAVRAFDFFYVVDPGADGALTRNGYYRIASGPGAARVVGWMRAGAVVLWPHRTALGLRADGDRERARFYASRRDLEAAHGPIGPRPAPVSLEPEPGVVAGLMPVLARFRLKVEGIEADGYHVAYRHGGRASAGLVAPAPTGLDVVFVLDTTNSMSPFIDATRDAVARVADAVSAEVPVRFGLVTFRDVIADPGSDWYVTRLACDLGTGADHGAFQRRLATVRAAACDSEDAPEEVLGGLQLAVEKAGWEPRAAKHIVLVGDASAQTEQRGPKNPCRLSIHGVLAGAQPVAAPQRQIAVHAVRVISAHPEDHERCERHFRQLAAGATVSGRYHEFDGRTGATAFQDRLTAMVVGFHDQRARHRGPAAVVAPRPRLGPLLESGAQRHRGAVKQWEQVPGNAPLPALYGVLSRMQSPSLDKHSAVDADGRTLVRGYVCELDRRGRPLLERYVLVTCAGLDHFDATLDLVVKALRAGGDPGARDVDRVLEQLEDFTANLSPARPPAGPAADVPLGVLLVAGCDVPATGRPFAHRIRDLAAMPGPAFERWAGEVEAARAKVRRQLARSDIWFTTGTSPTSPADRHAFLREDELP